MANKKRNITNQKKEELVQESLTKNELYDVLNFAQKLYSTNQFSGIAYSPSLTNERLGEITSSNSKKINSNILKNALKNINSKSSQETLIGYSEWVQLTEAVAKRSLSYIGNLPAFDYTFTCTNINDINEYNSEEYKNDLRMVKEFLNRFDVKSQFSYVHRRSMIIDAFFGILRTEGKCWVFQELPNQYCLITGKSSDYGFVFDFDMSWFLNSGLSIDQYPKNFRKIWKRVFGNNKKPEYTPANKLNNRKGVYSSWTQTSPLLEDGAFTCFKFNGDCYSKIPFLTSLFSDEVNKPLVRELQNNQYIIASQKLLIGLIPFIKDTKTAQTKDNLAIDAGTLGMFLALLKQGLSDAIKVGGVPFSDLKDISYDLPEKNMYQEYSKTLSSNTGVTNRLIYSDTQLSATEVVYNTEIDEMLATHIYPQYETWLSTMVNRFTQKYKFKFKFEGSNFSQNRKSRFDNAMSLADKGMVNFQKIASSLGMNVFEFQEQLAFSSNSNIWQTLKLLPNVNTASEGSEVGRPSKSMGEAVADTTGRNPNRKLE